MKTDYQATIQKQLLYVETADTPVDGNLLMTETTICSKILSLNV